jgi:hypothetical protein|tara:strand:- start:2598 stop:3065 length:468 start_codon:yes stop_codon:yes gene_type:complete
MAITENKNFLQPTGFRVIVEREHYGNLEFFAQTVQHPGTTVSAAEVSNPRLQSGLPVAGDSINYGELSLSLILDEDLTAYKEVQKWLEDGVFTEESPYHDITVIVLTSHNNFCAKIQYKNCIPTQLGAIEFASTTGDVTYINFDATFRFSEFIIS